MSVTPRPTSFPVTARATDFCYEINPLSAFAVLADLVDPLRRLYDDMRCRLVQQGCSNFREDSHVSQTASLESTADFRAAYERLGHGRQGQGS